MHHWLHPISYFGCEKFSSDAHFEKRLVNNFTCTVLLPHNFELESHIIGASDKYHLTTHSNYSMSTCENRKILLQILYSTSTVRRVIHGFMEYDHPKSGMGWRIDRISSRHNNSSFNLLYISPVHHNETALSVLILVSAATGIININTTTPSREV